MRNPLTVALGPTLDLHSSHHGALVSSPPNGISVCPVRPQHTFVHCSGPGFSPHRDAHLAEFISVSREFDVVHSAKWPVLGQHGWLVDCDDLLSAVMCGRTAASPEFRSKLRDFRDSDFRDLLRRRCEAMISSYAHPSCVGVLLRQHPEGSLSRAAAWFESLGVSFPTELSDKIVPIRPAQVAIRPEEFEAKWQDDTLEVVARCRDFDNHNGYLALKVMQELLASSKQIRCTFIGAVPDDVIAREPGLLQGIEHLPSLSGADALGRLQAAHILFYPAKSDNTGVELVDAMSSGLAVVTASGGEMECTNELFGGGGALVLNRELETACEEETTSLQMLRRLVDHPALAKEMATHNWDAARSGPFSLQQQQSRLVELYERAATSTATPLTQSDVSHSAGAAVSVWSSADLTGDLRLLREQIDSRPAHKCVVA